MIEIRYSAKLQTGDEMVDISGTWQEFEKLRLDILRFLESNEGNVFIDVDTKINSEGWDFILESLEIDQKGDAVKVSVKENKILKIKGSEENLKIFASWLESNENIPSGYHSHYEFYEGNEFINSDSLPLIIRIK